MYDSDAGFSFGAHADGQTPLDGLLDDIGVWKRKLSDTEVTWLYNSGAGRSYAEIVTCSGC
jgi:hypothetical protein